MRIPIELLMALAVFGWFASPCRAQDAGVEVTAQAERAVAQFEAAWSKNKTTLDALRARELDEKKALERILRMASLPKMQACPDQEKTASERAIAINLRSISTALKTAITSEKNQLEAWSNRTDESATAPYATRVSVYDKLVWSRARLKMMLFLRSVFDERVQIIGLTIDSTCAARKILSSEWSASNDVDILRTETSRREASEAPLEDDAFSDTLTLIMRMP
jgi:hypothetical protein